MGRNTAKKIYRIAACWGGILIVANAGCSLLSSKEETPSKLSATKVATNVNDIPLPVEINNDISKIAGGAGQVQSGSFSGGGSGRVNVNVNVNFNGRGWTKTVTESPDSGDSNPERQPANSEAGGDGSGDDSYRGSEGDGSGEANGPAAPGKSRVRGGHNKPSVGSGETKTYVVKPGDTLMKISFESYGNVYRWREILNANKAKIANYSALAPGTELTINGVDYVVIDRNGKPYLIVRRDTLGKISHKVYGTNSFWRELWKNNPQLIHNPHKIYAGFTLYYRDKSELGTSVQTALNSESGGKSGAKKARKLPSKRIPATNSKN